MERGVPLLREKKFMENHILQSKLYDYFLCMIATELTL